MAFYKNYYENILPFYFNLRTLFFFYLCIEITFILTLLSILENIDNLLISTKFNQVISNIHLNGFGVTAFKSSEAPPVCIVIIILLFHNRIALIYFSQIRFTLKIKTNVIM